jgi:hypothetical protein
MPLSPCLTSSSIDRLLLYFDFGAKSIKLSEFHVIAIVSLTNSRSIDFFFAHKKCRPSLRQKH